MNRDPERRPETVRVLLVEDTPEDARLIREMLRDGGLDAELDVESSLGDALTRLGEPYDAVLLDLNLPDSQGIHTADRFLHAASALPVIILTEIQDDAGALHAVQRGAQDYLVKERVSPPLLARSIRYAIERNHAQQALLRAEEALRQSQKLEAVGRLAGGVAHDFNNLLTAILGHAVVLLDAVPAQSPLREDVLEIQRAAERATSLTRQLLTFSRREVERPEVIDVDERIREVEGMLRRLIGGDVTIRAELSAEGARVRLHPSRLEQILMNLVINARDALPDGGTVTIRSRILGQGDERDVVLEVIDGGAGMDRATLEHVFEPFFTTKEVGKGTGLGLATVHGIVQAAGGRVEVRSELGRGTLFRVLIPASYEELSGAVEEPAEPHMPRDGECVLVVDDDRAIRRLVSRVLRGAGYRVLEADSAAQAVERASAHVGAIDVLLTDMVMPETSGHQLADRLGADRPGLRVILMSGYTESDALRRSVGNREVDFLPKPFVPRDLLGMIRRVLSRPG